jgi:uncharacterized membrane protein
MKTFSQHLIRHKYRLAIFLLLGAATVFCLLLVRARIAYSDTFRYTFLIWNLFLAWIPFMIAYLTYSLALRRSALYVVIPISAFLWLIFFPNAPYILTDFQHLSLNNGAAPLWFDVIMLIWCAWTGLLLGVVSLYLMQEIIKREFGRIVGWMFVFVVAALSSAGIYIGRFIRWNSWDVLRNPFGIANALLDQAVDPSLRSIGFIALYTSFFVFTYITLYAFGHLLQEQSERS